MLPIISRIKAWWTAADRTQRVVTLGGLGGLLFLLVVTALFATKTRYEILVSGVSEMEKGTMVEALTAAGIQSQYDQTGVIEVPAGKKEEAMMALAKSDHLPKTGHWGIDKLGTITPFIPGAVEDATLKAILEGQLSTVVEKMEGVASATVLITQPQNRVFEDQKQHPTASVSIVEDGSGSLGRKQGRTIATLIAYSVTGMTAADVVVTSTTNNVTLWDGADSALSGETKSELDEQASRVWEGKIQTALDTVFGANNTKVIARAELDMDHRTSDDHVENPTDRPINVKKSSETATGAAKGASGLAGSASNVDPNGKAPTERPKDSGQPGNYTNSGSDQSYGTTTHEQHTVDAVGDLKGLAISVVVNSDKVSDPTAVRNIVNSVLGGKIQKDAKGVPLPNQPFTADVTSVKFDGTAAAAAKAAADASASSQRMQQIVSLLPIGAILLVALLVAKQVGKISRAALPAEATTVESEPEAAMAELGYVANALPAAEGDAFNLPVAYEEGSEIALAPEEIKDRVNLPLESIKRMATDKPEMVATLIKSMMLGEKA